MDTRELLAACLWATGETIVLARLGCSGSKTNLTYNFKRNQTTLVFCFSDLDPCLNVVCPSFGVCKAYSPHETRCVCFEDCPTYQDPVCSASGKTYDNKCWQELSYCKGLDNTLVYHPGSCEGGNN